MMISKSLVSKKLENSSEDTGRIFSMSYDINQLPLIVPKLMDQKSPNFDEKKLPLAILEFNAVFGLSFRIDPKYTISNIRKKIVETFSLPYTKIVYYSVIYCEWICEYKRVQKTTNVEIKTKLSINLYEDYDSPNLVMVVYHISDDMTKFYEIYDELKYFFGEKTKEMFEENQKSKISKDIKIPQIIPKIPQNIYHTHFTIDKKYTIKYIITILTRTSDYELLDYSQTDCCLNCKFLSVIFSINIYINDDNKYVMEIKKIYGDECLFISIYDKLLRHFVELPQCQYSGVTTEKLKRIRTNYKRSKRNFTEFQESLETVLQSSELKKRYSE